jgi:hypothetical protein
MDAPMPPRRQDLVLEDAPLLRPAALLLGRLLVQVVKGSDGVAIVHVFTPSDVMRSMSPGASASKYSIRGLSDGARSVANVRAVSGRIGMA